MPATAQVVKDAMQADEDDDSSSSMARAEESLDPLSPQSVELLMQRARTNKVLLFWLTFPHAMYVRESILRATSAVLC
jgi:hypothetical protein